MKKIDKKVFLLTFVFAFAPFASDGEEPPQQTPQPQQTQSNEQKGNKKAWLHNMQESLPALLCEKDRYFAKCYQVTPEECINFTRVLVEACANNITLALPQDVDKKQGEYWGQMIGRCTYDLYEKFMHMKKLNLPDCQQQNLNKTESSSQTLHSPAKP